MRTRQKIGRRAARIPTPKLIIYDFDGVMTDNRVLVREDGLESVVVNRSDGLAVEAFKKSGIPQAILSKEKNAVVGTRAKKLGIPVVNGVDDKKTALLSYCAELGISPSEVILWATTSMTLVR